jgi:nucleoside-diphosphate-sugar epimerase
VKILITGKNGFVGKNLSNQLGYEITSIGREDFNLTNREDTNNWFKDKYFDVVIHTAILGGSRLEQDNEKVFFNNLSMFYNLLSNQDKFGQLISFGSGAELGYPTDPYGLSKNIIHRIISNEPKFNNIRIFAVFDENELDTRFIKSNIKRYINKEPLIIHQNKYMDFIYIEDLILLVKYIIQNPDVKVIDANYVQPYTLKDIALLINELDNHQCEVIIKENNLGKPYVGSLNEIKLPYIGLEKGIKKVYEALN